MITIDGVVFRCIRKVTFSFGRVQVTPRLRIYLKLKKDDIQLALFTIQSQCYSIIYKRKYNKLGGKSDERHCENEDMHIKKYGWIWFFRKKFHWKIFSKEEYY